MNKNLAGPAFRRQNGPSSAQEIAQPSNNGEAVCNLLGALETQTPPQNITAHNSRRQGLGCMDPKVRLLSNNKNNNPFSFIQRRGYRQQAPGRMLPMPMFSKFILYNQQTWGFRPETVLSNIPFKVFVTMRPIYIRRGPKYCRRFHEAGGSQLIVLGRSTRLVRRSNKKSQC